MLEDGLVDRLHRGARRPDLDAAGLVEVAGVGHIAGEHDEMGDEDRDDRSRGDESDPSGTATDRAGETDERHDREVHHPRGHLQPVPLDLTEVRADDERAEQRQHEQRGVEHRSLPNADDDPDRGRWRVIATPRSGWSPRPSCLVSVAGNSPHRSWM